MRWRTATNRKRLKNCRTIILVFNRGSWTRPELCEYGMYHHVPFDREQPRVYRKYRH